MIYYIISQDINFIQDYFSKNNMSLHILSWHNCENFSFLEVREDLDRVKKLTKDIAWLIDHISDKPPTPGIKIIYP